MSKTAVANFSKGERQARTTQHLHKGIKDLKGNNTGENNIVARLATESVKQQLDRAAQFFIQEDRLPFALRGNMDAEVTKWQMFLSVRRPPLSPVQSPSRRSRRHPNTNNDHDHDEGPRHEAGDRGEGRAGTGSQAEQRAVDEQAAEMRQRVVARRE
ncbi:hypothetical protein CONLIGDRAFT_684987 [Coniochaeta ligniaria NRRL 30616]|uniref:Uncharacterized protein n=1 Tax=Coniochaeta ligniaria NRRL 30616 TaxID=1408157 RepID=A0A1J7ICV3_9PEZI|nr:hypothetical protein CONLIGDRAFT_684987 [Coniochaeta ligniaria NRRL 30616]